MQQPKRVILQPLGVMNTCRPKRVKSSSNKGNDHLKDEGFVNESVGAIAVDCDGLDGIDKMAMDYYIESGDESALDYLD